jgi:hypothetical protein
MPSKPTPDDQQAQAITRLVDEPGLEAERAGAGAWADQPEIRRQVESERRVAAALRTGGPAPPDRLVHAVETKVRERYGAPAAGSDRPDRAGSGRPGRPESGGSVRASRPAWRPTIAVAGLAAVCAAVVIGIVGIGGGGSGPSIPAAAALAFAPSTAPAPPARSAKLLDVSYGGVTYPNYAKFSVPPTGERTDHVGGRPALTVFYRLPNGTRLSYTVFSGNAVPLPHDAQAVRFEGVPLHVFTTSSGLSVVTLVRYGRTCVLAARTKPDVVLSLAAAPVLANA